MNAKPYSEACERNKAPILEKLIPLLTSTKTVLEIGSGTGQHACYFAEALKHLKWQTSDCEINHSGINAWIDDTKVQNVLPPIALDVLKNEWPERQYDAAYSANTAHIMPWEAVIATFIGLGKVISEQGLYLLYGPFKYNNQYTSESNAEFDRWLQQQAAHQSIRSIEAITVLGRENGFKLIEDYRMPANNQLLVFRKRDQ